VEVVSLLHLQCARASIALGSLISLSALRERVSKLKALAVDTGLAQLQLVDLGASVFAAGHGRWFCQKM